MQTGSLEYDGKKYDLGSNGQLQTDIIENQDVNEENYNSYTNGHYDRDAAVAYATNPDYSSPEKNEYSFLNWEKHTRNYNSEYERYDSFDYYEKGHLSGSDCANFISQALYAGGIKQTDYWNFKWKELYTPVAGDVKLPEASASWIRPEAQLKYLQNNGYVAEPIEITSADQVSQYIQEYGIQKGDIIYLKNEEEGLHHAMMITDVKEGNIYISAHSNDHISAVYDRNYFNDGNIGVIVRMY